MNIRDVKKLSGWLTIDRKVLKKAFRDLEKNSGSPERCFLDDMSVDLEDESKLSVEINDLEWSGARSGCTFNFLKEKILPLTKGHMDAVFSWEGGHISGLKIQDGVVTDCDVNMFLSPKQTGIGRQVIS